MRAIILGFVALVFLVSVTAEVSFASRQATHTGNCGSSAYITNVTPGGTIVKDCPH
jgi:hypothetical protein